MGRKVVLLDDDLLAVIDVESLLRGLAVQLTAIQRLPVSGQLLRYAERADGVRLGGTLPLSKFEAQSRERADVVAGHVRLADGEVIIFRAGLLRNKQQPYHRQQGDEWQALFSF